MGLIFHHFSLFFLSRNGNNSFRNGDQGLFEFLCTGVYTFGLQKNSSLTHVLNTAMLQLGLNGVLDGLHKKWIDDLNVCSSDGVRYGCILGVCLLGV